MEIRKASVQDLGQIMQVYDKARKFMRENGNAEQWGEDYPSAELIEHDIDKMYLCMSEGRIACVFYYAAEEDEDYKEINGKWLNEEPYGVVHRVASTGIVRGAASFCLDWAYAQTQNLRMDTYSDNIPMQKLLEKCGFQYHHTEKDKPCPLMGEVRTEYFTYLSKEQWEKSAAKEGE